MKNIIIADDNEMFVHQLVNYFKLCKEIEIVAIANNGEEELEYIKKLTPDIVITDIEMPKLTGLEVIKKVKGFEKIPEFIVMTGRIDAELINIVQALSVKDLFCKPIDIEKLKNAILS